MVGIGQARQPEGVGAEAHGQPIQGRGQPGAVVVVSAVPVEQGELPAGGVGDPRTGPAALPAPSALPRDPRQQARQRVTHRRELGGRQREGVTHWDDTAIAAGDAQQEAGCGLEPVAQRSKKSIGPRYQRGQQPLTVGQGRLKLDAGRGLGAFPGREHRPVVQALRPPLRRAAGGPEAGEHAGGRQPGDRVLLEHGSGPDGELYYITDFVRWPTLLSLTLLFAAATVAVGQRALVSMGVSLLAITGFIIPGITSGHDPPLVCMAGSLLLMIASLSLVYGRTWKTHTALDGDRSRPHRFDGQHPAAGLCRYVAALFLLLASLNIPLGQTFNREFIVEEIVRTLAGSLGLILAVPVTSLLASLVAQGYDPAAPAG